jgi:transcriptional regulator with XRE-family HTH domain
MDEKTKEDMNKKTEQTLKRIEQIRKQKGYSLENMGFGIGVSESAYRKIVNNQVKFTVENLFKIAHALDVSISELVGDKSQREYHQYNNDKGTFIGHQEGENIYQDNKEIVQKLINTLEKKKKNLQEENVFLRSQLSGK